MVIVAPTGTCLKEAPPAPKGVDILGPEQGCPEAFAGCLSMEAGANLADHLRRQQSWAREAWIRCGPPPDAGVRDGGI